MHLANEKFKNLKTKGIWNAPSAQEEQIIALQSEVDKLSKAAKADDNDAGKDTSKSDKDKQQQKPAWMSKAPESADLTKPRKWLGHSWYYCDKSTGGKCDGVWRRHKPSNCEGKAKSQKKKRNNDDDDDDDAGHESTTKKMKLKLKLKKAYAAMRASGLDIDDSDEDSDEE